MKSFRSVLILLAFGFVGCSPSPLAIPGCSLDGKVVGDTFVHYGTFRDSVAVVVWSDLASAPAASPTAQGWAHAGSGVSASSDKAEYQGTREASDGRAVKWKAGTKDGKTGTVTVNDKDYRLEDGAVFLVRTTDGPVRVTQVKHDLSGMKATSETWELLGKQNSEVKKFLAELLEEAGGKK